MTSRAGALRIMHAISSDRFAGVEQFVRRLATRQAQDGHTVTVVGGAGAHMSAQLEDAGVEWSAATTTRQVFTEVRRRTPSFDIVNTHMTAADAAAVVARALAGREVPIIATRHFAQTRGSIGPRFPYRILERQIDAEIAISQAVAERIGVASTVVHPGVEPTALGDPALRQNTVLVAQRLQPEKQTALALRAFAASGIAESGWTLEIAGTGPERRLLESLADSLQISMSVRFLGFRTDIAALMAEAGILLASSPFEHFGLTVLEAMGAGLPVVAADSAGHTEMLGGLDDRALFPPGDAAGAAARLRALATDPVARADLGARERHRQMSRFSLRAQADATEAIYRAAITKRATRR